MADTVKGLADEILLHLRNLKTAHETEARSIFWVGISAATAINFGLVDRLTPDGRAKLTHVRDMLKIWRDQQYDISSGEAGRCAIRGQWPDSGAPEIYRDPTHGDPLLMN